MSDIQYTGGRRGGRRKVKKSRGGIILLLLLVVAAAGAAAVFMYNGLPSKIDKTAEFTPSSQTTAEQTTEQSTEETTADYSSQAESILKSMTIEEKICQMFFITPEALTGVDVVTAAAATTKNALTAYPVGGLIYFDQNIESEKGIKEMLANTKAFGKEVCKAPLFLGIDEEGGTVARLGNSPNVNVPKVPDMCTITTEENAYNAGSTIGAYLAEYGFNMDFAPVADVLTNDKNTVVQKRSFGKDPAVVSSLAIQFSNGLNDKGILSCYKHFPGHGATADDSHEGLASVNKTYDDIAENELLPFGEAVKANADFIMAGHISLPNIIGDNTPASLSKIMLTDTLINKMGYKGIVITDSLSMGAVTNLGSSDKIAIDAINAGADMLLMPQNFQTAYNGVLNAVNSGEISEERINTSVLKILTVKQKITDDNTKNSQ